MPMRPARKPRIDLWRLVGRIAVHQQMHLQTRVHRSVDPLEQI